MKTIFLRSLILLAVFNKYVVLSEYTSFNEYDENSVSTIFERQTQFPDKVASVYDKGFEDYTNRMPFFENILGTVEESRPKKQFNSDVADIARRRDLNREHLQRQIADVLNHHEGRKLTRQLGPKKHHPICHTERRIVSLNTLEYEYRPAYYEEVKCIGLSNFEADDNTEICSELGFTCFQWNTTVHFTRRRYTSDCWESKSMTIPTSCECMWPIHKLGDIKFRI